LSTKEYVLNLGEFALHPHLHQVSKSRDLHICINNELFEMITWAQHCPELRLESQAMVVREMLYQSLHALQEAYAEGYVPEDYKRRLQQYQTMARYAQLKDEREREQAFLRMARDELLVLLKTGQEDRAKEVVEETLADFAKAGDTKAAVDFTGLPVVGYILDGGEWDEEIFGSERGIV